MKTAISLPDDLFEHAERLARRTKRSRSQLFSDALREYLARPAPDEVTEAMNRVCALVDASPDEFNTRAARRVLARSEWKFRKAMFGGQTCPIRRVQARDRGVR